MKASRLLRFPRFLPGHGLWLLLFVVFPACAQPGLVKVQQNTFAFMPDQATILTPVLADIAAAQVLFVGELDHGDGSAHPLKVQLLHQVQQLGTPVAVAYEADFFALNHRVQHRPLAERLRSLPPIWTECSQFAPFTQYLLAQHLPVYGTDPRLVSPYSKQHLLPYLDSLLPAHPQKAWFLQELHELQQQEYFVQTTAQRQQQFLALVQHYQPLVPPGFDQQLVRTIEAFARNAWQGLNPKKKIYYRDQAMGENLFWLQSTWLRDTRVVFFGANVHIGNTRVLPAPAAHTTVKATFDAHHAVSSYAIAMIAYEGVAKRPTMPAAYTIPAYLGEGLEKSLQEEGLEFALVNLRAPDVVAKKFYVRGFDHGTKQKAVWSRIYDCFLYSKVVVPCGAASP